MYTKENLQSEEFIRLYNYVGKNSDKMLLRVEEILRKRKTKKDLDIKLGKETFVTRDDTMHYSSNIHTNNDGRYIKANITKTKDTRLLDISLELGIDGYDYSTGERFDRKQAQVSYSYEDGIIDIKEIKDEEYFNNLEEEKKKKVQEIVSNLKK